MSKRRSTITVVARWWWLVLVVAVFSTWGLSLMVAKLGWLEFEYESSALIEDRPIVDVDFVDHDEAGSVNPELVNRSYSPMSRRLMNTSFGPVIVTPLTLEAMLNDETFLRRLGGDRKSALVQLRSMLRVELLKGTDLWQVSARSSDPVLARDVVVAVCEAYRQRRRDLERSIRNDQLKAIKVELKNKADRIRELKERQKLNEEQLEKIDGDVLQKERLLDQGVIIHRDLKVGEEQYALMEKRLARELLQCGYGDPVLIVHQEAKIASAPFSYRPLIWTALCLLPCSLLLGLWVACRMEHRFPQKSADIDDGSGAGKEGKKSADWPRVEY